ncbi:GtrA family protein [Klebsiella pneumoniae]
MHLGLGIYLSNAMGYVVGIVFSFIANTIFTFTQPIREGANKFLI